MGEWAGLVRGRGTILSACGAGNRGNMPLLRKLRKSRRSGILPRLLNVLFRLSSLAFAESSPPEF